MSTQAIQKLSPVDALDVLTRAHAELSMVVAYGLNDIKDGIDREHIATAYALIGLALKAQRGY